MTLRLAARLYCLLAGACGDSVRLDLVFRILPGPGNYRVASGRSKGPGFDPSGVLLNDPRNQNSLALSGSASFWGQYLAEYQKWPSNFTASAISLEGDVARLLQGDNIWNA